MPKSGSKKNSVQLNEIKKLTLNLMKGRIADLSGHTLVLFAKPVDKNSNSIKVLRAKLPDELLASCQDAGFAGTPKENFLFRESNVLGFRNLILVGLGSSPVDHEDVRQIFGSLFHTLAKVGSTEVCIDLDGFVSGKNGETLIKGAAEGLLLANYDLMQFKTNQKAPGLMNIHFVSEKANDKKYIQALKEGIIVSDGVNLARRLGDTPANFMTPTILAEEAVSNLKGLGVKVEVWDKPRLKKERMGGLLGVAQGSDQDPRFIIMEYKGGPKTQKPLVLAGKGLTFDIGGYNIKLAGGMLEDMKYDMCGGAAVISAMKAIAELGLKVNVVGLVASTENLINGSATKPGDVHYARNGKSFQVDNTDAEGRLILADTLTYASELNPAAIFDVATLTGAIMVSLGNIYSGFFTRSEAMRKKLQSAADASGEWIWQMPLCDHHLHDMKGRWADLTNLSVTKTAGSSTAAAFLEQFVGEGIPWAHIDIAGTAWNVHNRLNYCPKGAASGVMVRTFVELARSYQ